MHTSYICLHTYLQTHTHTHTLQALTYPCRTERLPSSDQPVSCDICALLPTANIPVRCAVLAVRCADVAVRCAEVAEPVCCLNYFPLTTHEMLTINTHLILFFSLLSKVRTVRLDQWRTFSALRLYADIMIYTTTTGLSLLSPSLPLIPLLHTLRPSLIYCTTNELLPIFFCVLLLSDCMNSSITTWSIV